MISILFFIIGVLVGYYLIADVVKLKKYWDKKK